MSTKRRSAVAASPEVKVRSGKRRKVSVSHYALPRLKCLFIAVLLWTPVAMDSLLIEICLGRVVELPLCDSALRRGCVTSSDHFKSTLPLNTLLYCDVPNRVAL